MSDDLELSALISLSSVSYLGAIKIRLLINVFGDAVSALNATVKDLAGLPGFGPKILNEWENRRLYDYAQRELDLAARHGVSIIAYSSPLYPKKLLEIPDHPILLYVKGSLLPSDQRAIAVIGTRTSSLYGNEMALRFSQDLTGYGFTVISGLARGVDTAAHYGALRKGRTIGVIGSGLADIYPRENIELAQEIAANGALISEFPMLTPPDRQNFPQRNRIVSGMSLGALLVEAPLKSGAMLTMERARAQNRQLFAIPGRLDQDGFRGNHHLIKTGLARLVENAGEISSSFDTIFSGATTFTADPVKKIVLEPEEAKFLDLFPQDEISYESLSQLTQMPAMNLNVILMSLILKKAIKEFPGKLYKKIR